MTRLTIIALAIAIGQALAAETSNLQPKRQSSKTLLTDINTISQYWGQQSFVAHFTTLELTLHRPDLALSRQRRRILWRQ
jgi:hypothetical protein